MPNSPSFVEHALDLLATAGPIRARAMFGGHGLYSDDVMIALLLEDELYLKTDEASRGRFLAEGCTPFTYETAKGKGQLGYFRPPDDAHEDAEAMRPWALLALEAALRTRASKLARGAKKNRRTSARGGRTSSGRSANARLGRVTTQASSGGNGAARGRGHGKHGDGSGGGKAR